MQKTYELVCVLSGGLSTKDADVLKTSIEKEIPTVVATDDMGIMPTMYPMQGHDQAYYVSYHMQATPDQVAEMKLQLRLMKGLVKSVFYAMKDTDTFLTFGALQKSFDAIVAEEEERKQSTQKAVVEEEKEIIAGDVVADAEEETEEA